MDSISARLFLILLLFTELSGCATNMITGRSQAMIVSDEAAAKASSEGYSKLINEAAQKATLDASQEQTTRVQSIAKPLISEAIKMRPAARNWQWDIHVIKSDEVNAWCMAGGKMAIYTGLLDKVKPTDDELAAVMGHEIAHALLSHQAEKMSRQMMQKLGINAGVMLAGFLGYNVGALGSMADMATTVAVQLPNSREAESEADRVGVKMAAQAAFNPEAAVTLWEKMIKISGNGTPQWLSTHPDPSSRIAAMKIEAKKLMPVYQAAKSRITKGAMNESATLHASKN